MLSDPPPIVLLASDAPFQREIWERIFQEYHPLQSTCDELSAYEPIDLLVTDCVAAISAQLRSRATMLLFSADLPGELLTLDPASTDKPFGVSLPANTSPEELRRTALLLLALGGMRRQLQDQDRRTARLAQEAATDHLTGLPNRRAWDRQLAEIASEGGVGRTAACVAIFDLDHFKRVNDTQGHEQGDRLLRAVGEALRASLRKPDVLARLGGDEFAVLFRQLEAPHAAAVVERVRRGLAARLVVAGQIPVTASVGYCVLGERSPDEVFRAADEALRRAKQAGRDCSREAQDRSTTEPPASGD